MSLSIYLSMCITAPVTQLPTKQTQAGRLASSISSARFTQKKKKKEKKEIPHQRNLFDPHVLLFLISEHLTLAFPGVRTLMNGTWARENVSDVGRWGGKQELFGSEGMGLGFWDYSTVDDRWRGGRGGGAMPFVSRDWVPLEYWSAYPLITSYNQSLRGGVADNGANNSKWRKTLCNAGPRDLFFHYNNPCIRSCDTNHITGIKDP